MQLPSPRVEVWFLAMVAVGVGLLAVPDTVTVYQLRFALAFWSLGLFLFIFGFPTVRKRLHLFSKEERQRREKAQREYAMLTLAEKIALRMYLKDERISRDRIEDELRRLGVLAPGQDPFTMLDHKTSFMDRDFVGPKGVKSEWQDIVRDLVRKPPVF
jgi:hypothetical protein